MKERRKKDRKGLNPKRKKNETVKVGGGIDK